MAFKLLFRKATARTAREVLRACGAARKNYELVFAPFSYPYPANIGASVCIAIYTPPIATQWAIRYPIAAPSNTFVAVVRFTSGGVVRRYKLWAGIGEVLAVPTYVGETLPAGAVIEIWSLPSRTSAVLAAQWSLKVTLLQDPSSPCDASGTQIMSSVCVPYRPQTTTPTAFNQCAL